MSPYVSRFSSVSSVISVFKICIRVNLRSSTVKKIVMVRECLLGSE